MKQQTSRVVALSRWRRCCWIAVVMCGLLLSQCSWKRSQWSEWHYIIPEGYSGFLAIQYNCPGGLPLHRQGQQIIVQFDHRGLACTSERPFASTGHVPTAETTAGRRIPYAIEPLQYTGFAMCCEHTQGIGGNTVENPGSSLILDILWVGYLTPRPAAAPDAPGDLQEFLQTRFGLQPIN